MRRSPLNFEGREEKVITTKRFAEKKLSGSGKHGIRWKEGSARARKTGIPQGRFVSEADIRWAVRKAEDIPPGRHGTFDLPEGHSSLVYMPDGTMARASRVFIKVYRNGKVHAYPLP